MGNIARIMELAAMEKDYADQIKAWKAEREDLLDSLDLGLQVEGDLVVEVKERKMFNAAQAKKVLTPEVYRAILVPKPDSTMAKKMLTGYEYEDCQKATSRYISVKKD